MALEWKESRSIVSNSLWPRGLYSPWNFGVGSPNTGVGSHSLLQGDWTRDPDPKIKPRSPSLQANSLSADPPGKPKNTGVGSLSPLQRIESGSLALQVDSLQAELPRKPFILRILICFFIWLPGVSVLAQEIFVVTYRSLAASWGGLSGCGPWAYLLHSMGNLSFLIRNWICVPCIARRILEHWIPREAPSAVFIYGRGNGFHLRSRHSICFLDKCI